VGVGCRNGGTDSGTTHTEGGAGANTGGSAEAAGGVAADGGADSQGASGQGGTAARPEGLGPGLPKESYTESQLFESLSILRSRDNSGSQRGHGFATMYKGYLVTVWARDDGKSGGGFDFWDIADPTSPVKVVTRDDREIRESHAWGFSSDGASEYVVLQATSGIQLWEWTDPINPTKLSSLSLPGVEASPYASGAWWTFSQGHYVYVGGSGNGLYVVDVKNPAQPALVRQVHTTEAGGFKIGPVFAVGNLLVASSIDGVGYASFDISEPTRPNLLWSTTALRETYSSLVNGNRIFGAGKDGRLYILSVDPTTGAIAEISRSEAAGAKGGYITLQSGFAFLGASDRCTKIDYRNETSPIVVGSSTSGVRLRDEDFCSALGNLAFSADDHAVGSALFAHAMEPDTTSPEVTMVNPVAGSVNRALTTRVGVTFSEEIDVASLTRDSFSVRPAGGAALAGRYSTQTGIVSFSPDEPLVPSTTYEVVVPAGGVRDISGNATTETFTASFATGAALVGGPLYCRVTTTPVPVGEPASLVASAEGGDGRVTFSYDFGDDSPGTAFSSASTASHAYASVGHFSVIVTARRGTEQATCSHVQAVHLPPSALPPTASSTILFEQAHDRVWVVNPDTNTVAAIDAGSNEKAFEVAVGESPRSLARAPDGTVWVANQKSASVSVLDSSNGELVATLPLPRGSKPAGVAFSPDGSAGYVTLEGTGQLVAFDPANRTVTGTLYVTEKPRAIAISGDSSRVLVTRFLSPDSGGEVVEVSRSPFEIARTFVLAHDPGPDTETSGRGLPNYLSSLVITPDGRSARVPSDKANLERGLQRDGEPLTFESTVRTIVSHLDLDANQEQLERRLDLNDRSLAQSLAFSKHGDWMFVASLGTNALDVFDTYSGAHVGGLSSVGVAPSGLVFNPDFTRLYVHGFLSRDVVVLDVSGFVTSSSTAVTRIASVHTVATETLAESVLLGKRLFYNADSTRMNRDSYLSCASCHLGGESDGRVWDFTQRGEGLRNTISLLGRRGTGQGRLHWTGNFDEIQDFEQDIRIEMGGRGFMKNQDFEKSTRSEPLGAKKAGVSENLDALADYVASLDAVEPSPFRNSDGSMTPDAQTGALIFAELGCASCHAEPDFTDSRSSALHDVGTITEPSGARSGEPLTGFDTPTLRGIWATAPYLHDGSAPTLLDVLTSANASDRHGATSGLSASELDALVAYLQQIE
jgi:DNA-binding beta-propeller fold protein YncE